MRCPSDISIMAWIAFIFFIISIGIYLKFKNAFLSGLFFSLMMNLVLFLESINNSLWFRMYNVGWLQYFSLFIWPVINIILVIWYVRRKK